MKDNTETAEWLQIAPLPTFGTQLQLAQLFVSELKFFLQLLDSLFFHQILITTINAFQLSHWISQLLSIQMPAIFFKIEIMFEDLKNIFNRNIFTLFTLDWRGRHFWQWPGSFEMI